MNPLEPIPIPMAQRWRQFRTVALPLLAFGAAVLGVSYLWQPTSSTPPMLGEVHGLRVDVKAPVNGTIISLHASVFGNYPQSNLLVRIEPLPDPRLLDTLAALRAELGLLEIQMADPLLDHQRNVMNWHGLQRDALIARAEYAALAIRERHAQANWRRIQTLHSQEMVANAEVELAEAEWRALQAEMIQREQLVARLDAAIAGLQHLPFTDPDALAGSVASVLSLHRERIAAIEFSMAPVDVLMPFDGQVSSLYFSVGSNVRAGDILFQAVSHRPDFIIGYLKRPFSEIPEPGTRLKITLPEQPQAQLAATITEVGAQFVALPQVFLHPLLPREERGLPIQISIPDSGQLAPGEIVHIHWVKGSNAKF